MAPRVLETGPQRRTLGNRGPFTLAGTTRSTGPSTSAGGAPTMNAPPLAAGNVPEFLTVEEAAELLRVNRKTLYEAIRLEQVPGVARLGRILRRSEEHTSELQSRLHLVCRLLLEKKKNPRNNRDHNRISRVLPVSRHSLR